MYRTFLSLRYLKARRTTWIGVAGIFLGVAALILILSIMSGFLNETRKHVRGSLADLIIQPLFEAPLEGGALLPTEPDRMLEIIRAHPLVEAACAQLQWYGMIAPPGKGHVLRDPNAGQISLVQLVGIDVEDEFQTSGLKQALLNEPLYPMVQRVADVEAPFAPPPGYEPEGRPLASVVLGEQLAANWYVHRGDEIEIVTASVEPETNTIGEPSNQSYVLSGTFRSGSNDLDMQRVYLDRRTLADLLGEQTPFSTVLVKLADYERDAVQVVDDLHADLFAAGLLHDPDSRYGRQEMRTWEEFKRTFLAAVENEKFLMGIMLSLVSLVASFTVVAILFMMVSEKRRDIGIICALGGSSSGIMALFLLIGFWQALVGATLGAIVGVWGAIKIDAIERWLSATLGWQIFDRNVYYFDHIPSVVEPVGVAIFVLSALVFTLIFAALPAWKASRLHPIDALRYE